MTGSIPDGRLVGLSLSYCIKDIIEGRVSMNRVAYIMTGTAARTEDEWLKVISAYQQAYWQHSPIHAAVVFQKLRLSNRIIQPRLAGEEPVNICNGHWMRADQ